MAYKDVMELGTVSDQASLIKILDKISFAPSCIDLNFAYKVQEVTDGFLFSLSFTRPDTHTGEEGTGYGREWFIRTNSSEKYVVLTVKTAIEFIITHEILECFHYDGVRLIDPHKSLEDLAYPNVLGEAKIETRKIKNS